MDTSTVAIPVEASLVTEFTEARSKEEHLRANQAAIDA